MWDGGEVSKPGPGTVLTNEEEEYLCNYLVLMETCKNTLSVTVYHYVQTICLGKNLRRKLQYLYIYLRVQADSGKFAFRFL